jgi:hypothetical protein
MLCSFVLALLGVVTIAASGIAVLAERPIVRSCSYFRCHVLAYGLSGVMFPGLMVMLNVMAHVPTLACLTLWGLLPRYSGLIIEDGHILYTSLHKEDIREERASSCVPRFGHLLCERGDRNSRRSCSRSHTSARAIHSFSPSDPGPHPRG